jgi:hypothetical protein
MSWRELSQSAVFCAEETQRHMKGGISVMNCTALWRKSEYDVGAGKVHPFLRGALSQR